MYRVLPIVLLATATPLAASEGEVHDCAALQLQSAYLTQYFCKALKDTGASGGVTRSTGTPDTDTADPLPDWAGIDLVKDAYRADPRKTLDLIKRIKSAGGLGDN